MEQENCNTDLTDQQCPQPYLPSPDPRRTHPGHGIK